MLYIASDHGGFKLKQQLVKFLQKEFGRVEDLGPSVLNPKDDYPKFAMKLAREVMNEGGVGILICRSGQGMCIAVNKFRGIRGAVAWDVKSAKASRYDDHANVLCLPSDYLSLTEAKKIVSAWLSTPWGKAERFKRRVLELEDLD